MMIKTTAAAHPVPSSAAHAGVSDPAVCIPPDHIGPYFMSGLGRMVWWTGRVAIGLRYEPRRDDRSQRLHKPRS